VLIPPKAEKRVAPDYQSPFVNIFEAVEKGTVNDVWYFVDRGANVNTKVNDDWTPLHHAAWNNNPDVEVFRYLISKGANVNAQNNDDKTPLDVANTEAKRAILRAAGGNYKIARQSQERGGVSPILLSLTVQQVPT
jgi:ankyrin repeat protein